MKVSSTVRILIGILLISVSIMFVLMIGYLFVGDLSGDNTSDPSVPDVYSEKEPEVISEKTVSDIEPEEETDVEVEPVEEEISVPALEEGTGLIYIGDSRFVGMNDECGITKLPDRYVVAEVGQGYSWLKRTALREAAYIEQIHPETKKWKYLICMGINDLTAIDDYLALYEQLSETKDVVLVSVGPVGNYPGLDNEKVSAFNEKLQSLGLPYIDYYSVLIDDGYHAADGLHYSDATYARIYSIIKEQIGDTAMTDTVGAEN